MLYSLEKDDNNEKRLKKINSGIENFFEDDLEKSIIASESDDGDILFRNDILDPKIFGEPLLLVKEQARTHEGKIADIVALDLNGNSVIIELKKNKASLGVDVQALQYLASFSKLKGKYFIKEFFLNLHNNEIENKLYTFFESYGFKFDIENINKESRIILIAQDFDPILFSMGEWLSNKGVPFKCIQYTPFNIEYENKKYEYIDFSIVFDRTQYLNQPLMVKNFQSDRKNEIFWHNIADRSQNWWEYLIHSQRIPACFDNQIGDQGHRLLHKYIEGDTIIAYASNFGAIGYGIIPKHNYSLITENSEDDKLNGGCLHRLEIKWIRYVKNLKDGIKSERLKKDFDMVHPLSTSVKVNDKKGRALIDFMDHNFDKINLN